MKPLVAVAGLGKGYRDGTQERLVLEDLTFTVAAGATLAICGPSGSGKSTLLNLIAGTSECDDGSVVLHIDGEDVDFAALSAARKTLIRRRHIGYVFQFFNLVPTLTVRENVLLPLELNGLRALETASMQRLESLGLADRIDDFPQNLSGGERQRTAIARALAHEPVLVLADEPTGNLDGENALAVAEMLWREVRALGSALLIATHNESIAAMADEVLRLDR